MLGMESRRHDCAISKMDGSFRTTFTHWDKTSGYGGLEGVDVSIIGVKDAWIDRVREHLPIYT